MRYCHINYEDLFVIGRVRADDLIPAIVFPPSMLWNRTGVLGGDGIGVKVLYYTYQSLDTVKPRYEHDSWEVAFSST